jgi:hypothetical protein
VAVGLGGTGVAVGGSQGQVACGDKRRQHAGWRTPRAAKRGGVYLRVEQEGKEAVMLSRHAEGHPKIEPVR